MTAIDGIDRLETSARWRPRAGAETQDVYVSIGEAELVVQGADGTALSHWSLPALVRLNPEEVPARYAPAEGADEELEIEETVMVAALDRVMNAVEMGRRRPGALRRLVLGLFIGFGLGLIILWMPQTLRDHASNVMPLAQREEIGARMLADLTRVTGPACDTPLGSEALGLLKDRVLPTSRERLVVVRDLPEPALALPGDIIVVSDALLVTQDDPEVAAGHILATALTARADPPLERFLGSIGFGGLVDLLIRGRVGDDTVSNHVEGLILTPPPALPPANLQPGFAAARLSWEPYAAVESLPEGATPPTTMPPALEDATWLALREICDG